MLNKLLTLSGSISSGVLAVFGASDEHRRFLESGYCCQGCGKRLTNILGNLSVNFYTADGRKISLWSGGAVRSDIAECPKCGHRWSTYGKAAPNQPPGSETAEIVETERREEFFGEDRRVIDNLRSSSRPTRTFSFSKEWSRALHIEAERAAKENAGLSLGAKDVAALQISSEEVLRRTYSISEDTKESSTEEISCEVPAHRKLTVIVRWKRIWQHGFVVLTRDDITLRVPFRVAVGVTFDQQQIEEEA
jgi:hypothetical protein